MDDFDFSDSIKAKSDQLNADDLIGGPVVVQITSASRGESDQPLVLHLTDGHQPWKPCKTSRRLLAACVGSTRTSDIVGRWVRLYRNPSVLWAGKEVGGIRFDAISGIQRTVTIALAEKRGQKVPHRVEVLQPQASTPPLGEVIRNAGATREHLDAWLASKGKPTTETISETDADKLRDVLIGPKGAGMLAEIRAMDPTPPASEGDDGAADFAGDEPGALGEF